MRSLALLDGPADHPAVLPCEIGTNKHVILSEAKDLRLRILRSFAVFAAQDDVSRFVIYTPLVFCPRYRRKNFLAARRSAGVPPASAGRLARRHAAAKAVGRGRPTGAGGDARTP